MHCDATVLAAPKTSHEPLAVVGNGALQCRSCRVVSDIAREPLPFDDEHSSHPEELLLLPLILAWGGIYLLAFLISLVRLMSMTI